MPKEALTAFQATLQKEPHRLGATLGAGTSAKDPEILRKRDRTTLGPYLSRRMPIRSDLRSRRLVGSLQKTRPDPKDIS